MHAPVQPSLPERADRLAPAGQAFLTRCRRFGAQMARSLANLGQSAPRKEAGAWSRRLTDEKVSLLSLVRGMEAEFLATGDGLERLAGQLGEIQKECHSLTELTLGQTQDAAVQFAFQLLKKAEDLVLASYEQYDHVFTTFNKVQQRLAQASKQREELMRVLLPLNFITMAFRIEASRHPLEVQQAFSTLADRMNRTVTDVRCTMERQFDELAASEQIARSLMEQISGSVRLHRKEVTSTLTTTRKQLDALSQALSGSGTGATDLAQRNKAVSSHINGIVMALQCQDITRQRIEHVGEAMEEMRTHLGDGQPVTRAGDANARQFAFQAGQIQLQQIQNVFDQLSQAAESLKSGIQNLRTEAMAAAELAIKVGGTALDAKVASQCQAGIGDTLGVVNEAVEKIGNILTAFAPLQASFVDCTAKATTLAGDVRHAGLNAQVFAIHASGGATLEVLAERVHDISEQVIQRVASMGTALSQTSDLVHNLQQRLEDFQLLCQAEQEVLADESALSQQKLKELERAIPLQIQRVAGRQETFAGSVEEALANIQFPETVAQASSRSLRFFQDLVAWGGAGSSGLPAETAASQKIDRLKSNYTMASERHAHTAALEPGEAPASAAVSESAIELFDEHAPTAPGVANSPAETPLPGERSEDQPRTGESAVAEAPPAPAMPANPPATERSPAGEVPLAHPASHIAPAPPATEKSVASSGLGDNVEMF